MKFDMHCHTAEGSIDGIIKIEHTIDKLIKKGYDGMLVTDHNSCNGYNSRPENKDFLVLRGIEYDTSDGGHMLIILPSNKEYDIFTAKGMSLLDTINVVHVLGGVIGAAHPYEYYKFGLFNHDKWTEDDEVLEKLDFIETFNACVSPKGNQKAKELAKRLNIAQTGGSDSHVIGSVGLGETIFNETIKTEDDLIKILKDSQYSSTQTGGQTYLESTKEKHKIIHSMGIRMYYLWSSGVSAVNRRNKIRKLKKGMVMAGIL